MRDTIPYARLTSTHFTDPLLIWPRVWLTLRQPLVEEGLRPSMTRKHSPNSARERTFDGAADAKLIVLACSDWPKGRASWTLTLLGTAVVERNTIARASGNTTSRKLCFREESLVGAGEAIDRGPVRPRLVSQAV